MGVLRGCVEGDCTKGMSYPMVMASLLTLSQLLSFRIDMVGPI